MGLQTSTPGVTNDLTAATNIETNWPLLDVHDHSSGKGAQVPTSGLNINANLTFGGYKAYNLLAAQFSNQSSSLTTATNKPCVYVLNGELRFIDNSGNDVLLTNSGSVAGTSGSISGLTAPVAAGFASNTFSWQANSGTGLYAKMSNADINLYEASAGVTNSIAIKSYPSLAASYSIILPSAVPASTSYLSMANTGQLATASADSIGSAMTSTGANAIANSRTRAVATTAATGGVAIGPSTTTLSNATTSYIDITCANTGFAPGAVNTGTDTITASLHGMSTGDQMKFTTSTTLPSPLAAGTIYFAVVIDANNFKVATSYANALSSTVVDITTQGSGSHNVYPLMGATIQSSGRPVFLQLIPGSLTNNGSINVSVAASSALVGGFFQILDQTNRVVGYYALFVGGGSAGFTLYNQVPPGCVSTIDPVSSGTYSYRVQFKANDTNSQISISYCKLAAFEI